MISLPSRLQIFLIKTVHMIAHQQTLLRDSFTKSGDQSRVESGKHKMASVLAVCLLLSCVGCTQFSGQTLEQTSSSPAFSLGDVMRGLHKPATPDDSLLYPAPPESAVASRADSEVRFDGGSLDGRNVDPYLANDPYNDNQRYVARQFPQNYSQPGSQPSHYAVAPQNPVVQTQATSPQTHAQPGVFGQAVNPSAPVYRANQFAQPAPPTQFNQAPTQFAPAPNQIIPPPTRGVPGPGVDYTPNFTPFGSAQPPTGPGFAPGDGTAFPPNGTAPVYTPTTRFADLIINGYPARTGRIMFGGAVNSDAGVTGQVTIDERNFDIRRWPRSFQELFTGQAFRGAGETFRIEAAPGSDFDRYTLQWATPNLFNFLPFSFSVSGFLFDRRFDDWDEQRTGGRLNLGYRISPDLSVSVGFSGQEVEVTNPANLLAPELNDVLGTNSLLSGTVSLKHDTRNSPIQTSSGHYFEASFEQAFGDFDYSRFELEFRQYWLLGQRIDESGKQTLSYSTQVGFSGDETPIFENFFAGGYATIRGFDFRGASPRTNNIEVGGQFQWLNTLEYMFPITADDAFRGVAFVDFGTVERDIDISSDNFRVAPGFGFRVAIPALGPAPLAFDFAFPVAMADTDDERVFAFFSSVIR